MFAHDLFLAPAAQKPGLIAFARMEDRSERPDGNQTLFIVAVCVGQQSKNRRKNLPRYVAWEIHPVMTLRVVQYPPLLFRIALLLVCLGHFARFIEHADDRPA
jgi:hypothetical protein